MRLLASLLILLVAGCAAVPPSLDLVRQGSLVLSGVPPIPVELVTRMQQYRSARAARLVGWLDEGVLVSMTGRAQRLRPGAREAAGAAAAWEMIVGITHRIGRPVPDRTPAQAFRRLADQHAAFAGLDYRAIGREGAVIAPVPQGPPAAAHDAAGDGLLVVPCTPVFGDAVAHRSDALEAVREPSHVGLAPAEAERLGVRTDARVRVTTPEGTAVLPLQVDSRLHEGAVYLVMGDPASGAARLLPVDRAPVRAAVSAATREEVGA